MKKHINITVMGKVQGVFFRHNTKLKADELSIAGYVKNQSDDSVFIEAEGDDAMLLQLKEWCHKGPSSAKVTNVNIEEGELQNYSQFKIKH